MNLTPSILVFNSEVAAERYFFVVHSRIVDQNWCVYACSVCVAIGLDVYGSAYTNSPVFAILRCIFALLITAQTHNTHYLRVFVHCST